MVDRIGKYKDKIVFVIKLIINLEIIAMTQQYPLYDNLLKRITGRKEEHSVDIKRMCATINDISLHSSGDDTLIHYEEIYLLILHYEILVNKGMLFSDVAYNGSVMIGGKGILYSTNELPPLLQKIIAEYLEEPNII